MSTPNARVPWLHEPTREEITEHADEVQTIRERIGLRKYRTQVLGSSFLVGGDPRVPFGFVAIDLHPVRFLLPAWKLLFVLDRSESEGRELGEVLSELHPGTTSIESSLGLVWLQYVARPGTTLGTVVSDRVGEGGIFGLLLTTVSSIYLLRSGIDGEVRNLTHGEVLSVVEETQLKELYRLDLIEREVNPI